MTELPQAVEELVRALGLDESDPTVAHALERAAGGDRARLVELVLIHFLWDEVVREGPGQGGQPEWVERWLALEASGFPFIDVPALKRLIAAGVDLDDLTDVVRSAQVLMLWNTCNLLDDPETLVPEAAREWVSCGVALEGGEKLGSLHEQLVDFDPSGRLMEPRTSVLRTFVKLDREVQKQLMVAVKPGLTYAPMAAVKLWAEHTGSSPKEALAAVKELERRRKLPMFDEVRPARRSP
jgi:hypothetical protein